MGVDQDRNLYAGYSQIPYKVMEYLMTSNENIWKLLKYSEPNALQQANLTLAQKRALIYNPSTQSDAYRLFTVRFIEDIILPEITHLHIYLGRVDPSNAQIGTIDIVFDAFCHNKIAILTYPNYKPNRYDVMFEELMKTLNGKDIDTLGRLYFNRRGLGGTRDGANLLAFSQDGVYQGYRIVMSTNVGDSG
jgi:hypothetical protein